MYSLRECSTHLVEFRRRAGKSSHDGLDIKILEWTKGAVQAQSAVARNVFDLRFRPECDLRVLFVPLDLPSPEHVQGHLALFEQYGFPSSFICERLQNVTHSFGSVKSDDGSKASWLHFLCKNIDIDSANGQIEVMNHNTRTNSTNTINRRADIKPEQKLSQADFSWHRSAFFLRTETTEPPSTSPSSSESTLSSSVSSVTLICFEAPERLKQRFEGLTKGNAWEIALQDPYMLYDIILSELYMQTDTSAWNLAAVFGGIEKATLAQASVPGKAAMYIDFPGLHRLAKHAIYLKEACDAILHTVQSIHDQHKHLATRSPLSQVPDQVFATQSSFKYRRNLFTSTQLRLISLEKRMQNIISLSFNLVAQHDSRTMQRDSTSMKTIAFVTLLFLPMSTVATVFGTQFVSLDDLNRVTISIDFWLLWVFAVPITVVTWIAWRLWYTKQKEKLMNEKRPLGTDMA